MYRYNENLTDLQKEFIKARKEARERIFAKVIFVLVCIAVITGTAFLAWFIVRFINPEMLVLTTLGAFILIWLIEIITETVNPTDVTIEESQYLNLVWLYPETHYTYTFSNVVE